MQALGVVETLHPADNVRAGFLPRDISLLTDLLHLQRFEEALHGRVVPTISLAIGVTDRPVHSAPACQVHHHGQIQPALVGGDLRDVAHPRAIGSPAIEPSIQNIVSNGFAVIGICRDPIRALVQRSQVLSQQTPADPFGLGGYFALVRPALLPEDPRFIGSDLAQI